MSGPNNAARAECAADFQSVKWVRCTLSKLTAHSMQQHTGLECDDLVRASANHSLIEC